MNIPTDEIPMPGEHHPWFERYYKELKGWLNIEQPSWQDMNVKIPVFKKPRVISIDAIDDLQLDMDVISLDRFRCWIWAPWTGTPYHYEWWGARDQYNRYVAGDQVFRVRELT
jgi:hypothetical protein